MRMSRVNITVPEDIVAQARAAGLNVSRIATAALVEELDRRNKIRALDEHLAQLEAEFGPIPPDELDAAARWADNIVGALPLDGKAPRRRSA
jgi:hypothetical protein